MENKELTQKQQNNIHFSKILIGKNLKGKNILIGILNYKNKEVINKYLKHFNLMSRKLMIQTNKYNKYKNKEKDKVV